VRTAQSVVPGSNGRPNDGDFVSVIVARILAIGADDDAGSFFEIDADIDDCVLIGAESQIIGRETRSEPEPIGLRSSLGAYPVQINAQLPTDARSGDLVAIPCYGVATFTGLRATWM
jgi:hypothetical protein